MQILEKSLQLEQLSVQLVIVKRSYWNAIFRAVEISVRRIIYQDYLL
jgi:hypothetical protein